MELRELIASTIWEIATVKLEYGEDPFVENTDTVADAILSALDAAGLVVVPREPTEEMLGEIFDGSVFMSSEDEMMRDFWGRIIAASPFAKKEVG